MINRSPAASTHKQVIDKILNRLAETEQPLPRSLEFYRRILIAQNKTALPDLPEIPGTLSKQASEHLNQGRPILTFHDLAINWDMFQKLFNELADLAIEFSTPDTNEVTELRQIGSNLATLKETAKTWFGSKTVTRKSNVRNHDSKPSMSSVLQATFYPLLCTYANKLMPLVTQELWYRRYCPICGGGADFGFLDKERDGARWLICSRCDAAWLFYRLVCPHCGNDDQQTLAYFTDDSGLYRLYVCEKCRRYLKTIDLRKTEAEILLPLERIFTLDLDRQAIESNYKDE